ncbi:SCO5717 family growth-regulating ATPase, partial [Streptomyces sp. RP5T]|uniref:SCO5717 family growth-regulating ATPase n=2 Tax=Streptomyces TaxID=1883 RepID=UPI00163B308E
MQSDRDGLRAGWTTPSDDQSDAESATEMTGEFTIDYAAPAWYTQSAAPEAEPAPPAPDPAPTAPASHPGYPDTSGS